MESFRQKTESILRGDSEKVFAVALTSDNKYIISGSSDNSVKIWNLLEKHKKKLWKDTLKK